MPDAPTPRRPRIRSTMLAIALLLPAVLQAQAQPQAKPADSDKPVILLTGFEPFKQGRPPNASWEAVASLNGKDHNGYKIACEQMQVVWGMPLKQYGEWVAKHKPKVILSFGEGGNGSFALETRAVNRRANFRDNAGRLPSTPTIAGDRSEVATTNDAAQIVEAMTSKGHTIRASRSAGQYLCEEALFSLEHLKSTAIPDTTVLFCHVPPLGGKAGTQDVTAEYLQKFVVDLIDTVVAKEQTAAVSAPSDRTPEEGAPQPDDDDGQQEADESDRSEVEVRKLVEDYFSFWSNQKMDDYAGCFHNAAVIQQVDDNGEVSSQAKDRFVAGQRQFQRNPATRAVEVPVDIVIQREAELMRAVVKWKLTSANLNQQGYDHFTFVKHKGRWTIINLIFYGTD